MNYDEKLKLWKEQTEKELKMIHNKAREKDIRTLKFLLFINVMGIFIWIYAGLWSFSLFNIYLFIKIVRIIREINKQMEK